MNTDTASNPAPSKPTARRDLLGTIPKAHDMRSITADQVAILGLDIEQDIGLPEGAWLLCDMESNDSEPSKELRASIYSSQKVNLPIKIVPVPVTPPIARFEARGKKGEKLGIVLLAVWGRHRVRAVRAEQREGKPIQIRAIVAGADESFQELALQAVIENATELRRRLLPIREARELGKLRDSGMNAAEIARRVGLEEDSEVTSATIRNKLALLNLGQSIADLVDSGKISVTHAYVIGKAPIAHHAQLADGALQGHTVAQLQRTARELVARDEQPAPTNDAPESRDEQQASSGPESSDSESDDKPASDEKPATGTAPTRSKRPKLADVAEMVDRLAGDEPAMAGAREALRFVLGEISDEKLIGALATLMGEPMNTAE